MHLKEFQEKHHTAFETYLLDTLQHYQQDATRLQQAMAYSLMNGGKRVRPWLILAGVASFGQDVQKALPVAAALEYIHTYSLIHDDLPAMDNDDFRRGQLTNHKQFDEATAILAGDSLQSAAFASVASSELPATTVVALMRRLGVASFDMVAGQMADIDSENQQISLAALQHIHALKTGALIQFACEAVGLLVAADVASQDALISFGKHFGLAFQIHNDLKDVSLDFEKTGKTIGHDADLNKNTYTSLLGIAGAKQALDEECRAAQQAIATLEASHAHFDAQLWYDFLTYLQ